MSYAKPRRAKPKVPEFDYDPPPPHPVVWVIVDEQDAGNVAEGFAQTAYKAFELSGICRGGQRLGFSQVRASISQSKTEQVWLRMLIEFLIVVSRPQKARRLASGIEMQRRERVAKAYLDKLGADGHVIVKLPKRKSKLNGSAKKSRAR